MTADLIRALERCENAIYNIGGEHVTDLRPALEAAEEAERVIAAYRAQCAAEAHGDVLVPLSVLEDASRAIGSFVSEEGWTDADMQAMDNLDAYIARHKANAAANVQPKGTTATFGALKAVTTECNKLKRALELACSYLTEAQLSEIAAAMPGKDWAGDPSTQDYASTQAPAPAPATGDTNGRCDGLRSAVHGRVAVGGYTPGALADFLWASPDVMSLNAELGLTMDRLVQLTQAVLTAVPCAAVQHGKEQP